VNAEATLGTELGLRGRTTQEGLALSDFARLLGPNQRIPAAIALKIIADILELLDAVPPDAADPSATAGMISSFTPHRLFVTVHGSILVMRPGNVRPSDCLYMAPEQTEGALADRRSRVWVAGVIAWELLAGQPLFTNKTFATLLRVGHGSPPRVASLVPHVPDRISRVVERALGRRPCDRYATAGDFRRSLLDATEGWSEIATAADVGWVVGALAGDQLQWVPRGNTFAPNRLSTQAPPLFGLVSALCRAISARASLRRRALEVRVGRPGDEAARPESRAARTR
jgi:serine/threonine protein kinase